MIRIVNKNPVIWFAVHNFPTPSINSSFISQKHSIQILSSHMLPSVILYSIKNMNKISFWVKLPFNIEVSSSFTHIYFCFLGLLYLTISLAHQFISMNSTLLFNLAINFCGYFCYLPSKSKSYLGDASINILSLWVVNNDSRPWIQNICGNIIIHKHHNILILQSSFLQQLISMADIRLFPQIPKNPPKSIDFKI